MNHLQQYTPTKVLPKIIQKIQRRFLLVSGAVTSSDCIFYFEGFQKESIHTFGRNTMGAIKTVVKAQKTSTAISAGVKGEQTDNLITGVHLGLVGVIALFGIGAAVFSMMATASLLVDIASVSTIALVFLAIFQRQRLENLGDIREQSEILAEVRYRDECFPMACTMQMSH